MYEIMSNSGYSNNVSNGYGMLQNKLLEYNNL